MKVSTTETENHMTVAFYIVDLDTCFVKLRSSSSLSPFVSTSSLCVFI